MAEGIKGEVTNSTQENVLITIEMIKIKVRNLPNSKAPGPGGVQGYWMKNLITLHSRIAK